MFGSRPPPKPLIPLTPAQQIMRETCRLFGVNREQLRTHRRNIRLVEARQHLAVRLTVELKMSRSMIGRFMNRDHSSIWNLLEREKRREAGHDRINTTLASAEDHPRNV